MAMRIIAALVALAIFGSAPAFSQSNDEELRFYPQVPSERSEVIAIISLTAPNICNKFESQGFELDGNSLSIYVRTILPPSETLCGQAITPHMLEQNIGKLDSGTYAAQLYVDGNLRGKPVSFYVSTSDIAILSTGRYIDDQGDSNLMGEVQNDANHPVKLVGIGISFFKDDTLVKEEQIYTTMAMIMPNRTSGFSLGLSDDLRDKEYSALVTSFSTEDKPVEKGLTLVVKSDLDSDGYGVVGGHVLNGADQNATQVKIVCAIYDSRGNVIDSIFGYTEPDSIMPGQTARFNIFTHTKISQEFTTSCNTESVELAVEQVQIVPEFPAIAAIAAALLAGVVAINRFRHKL
jgi:hypothetical protein